MLKKIKPIIFIILILSIVAFVFYLKTNKTKKSVRVANITIEDLNNISECSQEFMDKYFSQMSEVQTDEEKENMLIVISPSKVEETYGAKKIIEAPNNQYILQYENEDDKNQALEKLKENDSILSVEENGKYEVCDTEYNSWGIEKMSLDYAIECTEQAGPNDVTVAIIDTGCDMELFNKYYPGKIIETYNVLNNSTSDMVDTFGHGTHIAGTIAEGTPSNVKIIPIKVSTGGNIYNTDIIKGINYVAYNEKADVINMSFGGYSYNKSMEQAIESANQKNIISVAAAGNDNISSKHYPSSLDNTISISSIDSSLNKSSFSNYGSKITFTAPGTDIKSIMGKNTTISKRNGNNDGDDHETISGTSMATPHAVNAVAILKSYNKNLTLNNVIELLKKHAIDLGDKGWDEYYGYGLLSFNNAQFRDGENVDEFGVFKKEYEEEIKTITKIEIPYILLTDCNYYSINNLFRTPIRLYYNDNEYITKKIGELDKNGLEIIGYNPNKKEEQEIQIKYEGFILNETVPYPNNYQSGWEYTLLDNENIELTLYEGNMNKFETLYVPDNIEGYNVVSLAGNTALKSKVFGNAFDYYDFKEIVLPATLTNLGDYSLMEGNYERIVSLADSINIGNWACFGSDNFVSFEGVIGSLGEYSFSSNISLENITLADSITTIPVEAFSYCTNLKKLDLPKSLIKIEERAFTRDTSLEHIDFPEGLTEIGAIAFYGCELKEIKLPDSLEKIGTRAFHKSNITELYIPKNVSVIGERAFNSCNSLERIEVDEDNSVYDSRENCNAIIKTSTNTLIKGIPNTEIPNTIIKIDDYAFASDVRIENIEIPEGVIEIGKDAFYSCSYLTTVKIPRSVQTIGQDAFKNLPAQREDLTYVLLTILTYKDAYAKTYAVENNVRYEIIEPSNIIVEVENTNYRIFDTVDIINDIVSIKLYHDYGYPGVDSYIEKTNQDGIEDIINEGYTINYPNNSDSFRAGDEYYTITGVNKYGIPFEKQISVTILKAIPEYEIPDNIVATTGQKLSEIELPNGFEWMDENEMVSEIGEVVFKAKYIPEDTENYEIVENIDIPIQVENTKIVITPSITVSSKVYDGTNEIPNENINITNLENSDYTIVSSISNSANAGNRIATIKLRLTDEKFEEYSFDNGKQEKEFEVEFEITKADIELVDNTRNVIVIYDEEPHSLEMEIQTVSDLVIKFMDENGEYTLDKSPAYTDIGTYVIKYRIYINENYEEYLGERIIYICEEELMLGDVDSNGVVNATDYTMIVRYLKGYEELTTVQLLVADVDKNGVVNATDYTKIVRFLKGYETIE